MIYIITELISQDHGWLMITVLFLQSRNESQRSDRKLDVQMSWTNSDNLQVKTEEEVNHSDASMCPLGFSSSRESVCSSMSYSVTPALKIKPKTFWDYTEILKLDLKETTQYSVSFAFWFFQMEGVLPHLSSSQAFQLFQSWFCSFQAVCN